MRVVARILLIGALLAATASPALAAKPVRGCPNDSFGSWTKEAFREFSIGLGVPEELLGEAMDAGWAFYDKNGNGLLCIKDLPDTRGHLGSWVFNIIDDVSNH